MGNVANPRTYGGRTWAWVALVIVVLLLVGAVLAYWNDHVWYGTVLSAAFSAAGG